MSDYRITLTPIRGDCGTCGWRPNWADVAKNRWVRFRCPENHGSFQTMVVNQKDLEVISEELILGSFNA